MPCLNKKTKREEELSLGELICSLYLTTVPTSRAKTRHRGRPLWVIYAVNLEPRILQILRLEHILFWNNWRHHIREAFLKLEQSSTNQAEPWKGNEEGMNRRGGEKEKKRSADRRADAWNIITFQTLARPRPTVCVVASCTDKRQHVCLFLTSDHRCGAFSFPQLGFKWLEICECYWRDCSFLYEEILSKQNPAGELMTSSCVHPLFSSLYTSLSIIPAVMDLLGFLQCDRGVFRL